MNILRYTLLTDGSSDTCLIPIINWLIGVHYPHINYEHQFARNLGEIGFDLDKRVRVSLNLFPSDVLFIHRDSEKEPMNVRLKEINDATESLSNVIPVIPIRMSEAWLLSDEKAIREAVGNRNGKINLSLPAKKEWEKLPDPKRVLFEAMTKATEKSGRALEKFNPNRHRIRVSELTENFSNLRGLESFDRFESRFVEVFKKI